MRAGYLKTRIAVLVATLALASPALPAERFPDIDPSAMTPEQKAIADAIASGPRKSISGPFKAWLRSPVLADRLQKLGAYIRFDTSLPTCALASGPTDSVCECLVSI